jgi:hypothetical protein
MVFLATTWRVRSCYYLSCIHLPSLIYYHSQHSTSIRSNVLVGVFSLSHPRQREKFQCQDLNCRPFDPKTGMLTTQLCHLNLWNLRTFICDLTWISIFLTRLPFLHIIPFFSHTLSQRHNQLIWFWSTSH